MSETGVLDAAKELPGWTGERPLSESDWRLHKVYISDVWERLRDGLSGSLETFKRCLVEAHQASLVTLSRADLVEAMDLQKVAASEIRWYGATFNFIQAPRGGR